MRAIKYGLTPDEVAWVEDLLSNGESRRDAELVRYFVRGGLTPQQAGAVVYHRDHHLLNAYLKALGPLHLN